MTKDPQVPNESELESLVNDAAWVQENSAKLLARERFKIPDGEVERRWLVAAIKAEKAAATSYLAQVESSGHKTYNSASERDPDAVEEDFFGDLKPGERWLRRLVKLERSLFLSVGYEHCFYSEDVSRIGRSLKDFCVDDSTLLLKEIVQKNIELIIDGRRQLELATSRLEELERQWGARWDNRNPEYDDGYLEFLSDLGAATYTARILALAEPRAWECVQWLSRSPLASRFMPSDTASAALEGDKERFLRTIVVGCSLSSDSIYRRRTVSLELDFQGDVEVDNWSSPEIRDEPRRMLKGSFPTFRSAYEAARAISSKSGADVVIKSDFGAWFLLECAKPDPAGSGHGRSDGV